MRIGIDIDDTLVSSSESFDKIIKKYDVDFKKKFKDRWTEDEKKIIFKNYLKETLMDAKIKDDAKEVLDCIYDLGHELIIITARGNNHCEDIEEFTIDFIKQQNLKISEFHFRENKKSDLAKRLNIDLMIDDSDYVYNNMKQENIDCILFGDKIKTWKEVLEYIRDKEV